jgi:hypothetical protein
MKRLIIITFIVMMLIFTLSASGCGKSEDIDINKKFFFEIATEVWDIVTYNGYQCSYLDKVQNEDGSYTVTFKFENIVLQNGSGD